MSTNTVYIPYSSGTVLGSHWASPWIADSAAHAASISWRGQPVFTRPGEAFAWLASARISNLGRLDFAIARIDAETYVDASGVPRIHIDWPALAKPANQVVRADHRVGQPHPSVLNALHTAVHEHASYRRAMASVRRASRGDLDADVAHAVWRRTYPIAFRDAVHVTAGRIGHAAALLAGDPDPRADFDDATRSGLGVLIQTATALTDSGPGIVPAPPASVVDEARWIAAEESRGGWRHAVDRVWAAALTTAAADGVITAATALSVAWNTRTRTDLEPIASGSEQAVAGWLRRTLADTNRDVISQWLHAAGHNRSDPHPPRLAGGRQLTQVSATSRSRSIVDFVPTLVAAGAPAAAATGKGRSR